MINPLNLTGKTILVTGASSGIGRETALLLSQLGARLLLLGRNKGELDKTAGMLEGSGHQIQVYDLSDVDGIPRWMKEISANFGQLDGLVHSAGIQITKPLKIMNCQDVENLMRINVTAAFGLVKGFRQKGVCRPPCSVVFISSVMGLVGQPGVSAYSASKGALVTLAKSLALELSKENIRVNCVAPGQVHTEMAEKQKDALTEEQFENINRMHPLGIGSSKDVAYAIAFLLADTGRWITGTTLVVDGGYTAH